MTRQLAQKTALVTGGSRGIGAGIVKRLTEDGAQVAFTYVQAKEKAQALVEVVEAAGGRAMAVQADNGDVEAVRRAVTETVRTFGGLDILVNNAGYGEGRSLADISVEDFDRAVAVNVRGAFVAAQEALPHLREGGRIINIGSVFADRLPVFPGASFALYSLTKGAVAGWTRGLARELAPRGITVNNIQPGVIATDVLTGAAAEIMVPLTPAGRAGEPADIAGAVAYLASAEASFVNGATWTIDGAYST
ncbi:SDR family oxidoreductase [Streptomyces sp. NPDC086077]|uniref:SDR family NAD(P)-dependent oxidoreductase n=1 Tax=Streptomyces sp. NPDC086077 TaxID=3154862 RepID=UPI003414FA69